MATPRTIRPSRRHERITLGDEAPDLRWVHLFGDAPIHVRGEVWDMGAAKTEPGENRWRFEDAVTSVQAELADYHPPMLRQHEHDGSGFGLMRRVRVLTRDEAAKHGIRQSLRRVCYGGFEITDPVTLADYDNGRIQYVSPEFRALFKDDAGRVHSLFVAEVSRVSSPVLKSQQTPVSELRGISLGDRTMKCSYTDRAAMAAKCAEYGIDAEKIEELLTAVLEGVQVEEEATTGVKEDAENAAIEDLRKAQEAESAAMAEAAKAKLDTAAMSDRLRKVEGALATEKRLRLAATYRAEFPTATEVQRNAALKLADTDEAAGRALLADIAKSAPRVSTAVAAATSPRSVGGTAPAPVGTPGAITLSDEIVKSPAKAKAQYDAMTDETERGAFVGEYRKARGISLGDAVAELFSGKVAPRGASKAAA